MKKVAIILAVFLLSLTMVSQQYPLHTNYIFNSLIHNPAMAGASGDPIARVSLRKQWVGIDGGPFTGIASYDAKLDEQPIAVGGFLMTDVLGSLQRTGISGAAAYQLDLLENRTLGIGISAGLYRIGLSNGYNAQTTNDVTLVNAQQGKMLPDFSLGVFYKSPTWLAGLSVPQAFRSKVDFNGQGIESVYRLERTMTGFLGYNYALNENFRLQPMVVMRYAKPNIYQFDLSARINMYDQYWVMGTYRFKDAAAISAGVKVNESLEIGYGYDLSVGGLASYNSGSHEVMVAYRFSECKDADGDGICDKDDECPQEAGPKDNNGCPKFLEKKDIDKDGIPDEDDDCPNTIGLVENDGCPVVNREEQQVIDYAVNKLEFEFDKAVIEDTSKPHLQNLAALLKKKGDWQIKVSGHTDAIGSDEYNIKLSRARAYAVRDYLVKQGISEDRILVEFFGEYIPVEDNQSDEGRQRNRRVEMEFVFD
jgi:type IX secretion system PorP/SprF family membrane protein